MEIVLVCVLVFGTIFLYSLLQEPFGRFMQRRLYKTFLKQEDYYRNIITGHLAYFRRLNERQLAKLHNLVLENQELFKKSWFEYFK